ncbi:glycoside hydrolase family 6 protein [Microbacterium sp. M1A1_1b]
MRTTTVAASAIALVAVLCGVLTPISADAATTATDMRARTASQLFGAGQYRSPTSEAAKAAAALRATDPAGADAAATIARYPVATWLGEWTTGATLTKTIAAATAGADATGTTAVFVTYAIPDRDCGGYSAGGFDEASYDAWIDQVVRAVAGKRAAVVVEPDSLAMLSDSRCTAALGQQRFRILSREVAAFTAAGVPAYLDAGNSNWIRPALMAERLQAAGVRGGRGFFTNVANYYPTAREQAYAEQVSALTGGSHYVIDTSRNGTGWRGTWCNAPGAGLGTSPRVAADGTGLDALLWVKTPGASDGTCNGGPPAGTWWSAAAQGLVGAAQLGGPQGSPASSVSAPGDDATDDVPHTPVLAFDRAGVARSGMTVSGWSIDEDEPASAVTVAVTVDGRSVATLTADAQRPDLVGLPTGAGTAHGWSATVPGGAGTHRVCAVARNLGPGSDSPETCRTVSVTASAPFGTFGSASSPSKRRVDVAGWVFDRDQIASAVTVTVTVDGSRTARFAADAARPDVDRSYASGTAHGFAARVVSPSGQHRLCVTASGLGAGGDTVLGCRTVTVR